MHLNPNPRFLKLALAGSMLATLFGLNFVPAVHAATPLPVCSGSSCTVTFAYTGSSTTWAVPAGITSLSFDVQGAQGGGSNGSGGLGGRVTGRFINIPTEVIVVVGNKGSSGNGVTGGFNGGGVAGVGDSTVGSGGGATDLRSSSITSSRFVIAGGGGGGGAGPAGEGGAGGSGGDVIGQAGGSGLGAGGGAGTASAGGSGGAVSPAGGTAGQSGSLANGGNGGSGTLTGFGGGGGGGGYYGGGGGGGDSSAAGLDGGGGGGGSSYASPSVVADVVHTQGYRAAAGQVILTYTFPPKVTAFAPKKALFGGQSANFDLVFDQPIEGLAISDFRIMGSASACTVQILATSSTSFEVIAVGCDASAFVDKQATIGLALAANSVTGAQNSPGPAVEVVSGLTNLDQSIPSVLITSPTGPTAAQNQEFLLSFDEPITGLEVGDIQLSGRSCQVLSATNPSLDRQHFTILVGSCADDALLELTLRALSVSDIAGNLAPVQPAAAASVQIDRIAPSLSNLQARSWRTGQSVLVDVSISEIVTALRAEHDLFSVVGAGCSITSVQANSNSYLVTIDACLDGSLVALEVPANSFSDLAGNIGPISASSSDPVLIDLTSPTVTFGSITQFTPQTSPSFNLSFSELVEGFDETDVLVEGSAANCSAQLSVIAEGLQYQLETFGCEPGTVVVRVLQGAVTDASGNQGPASDQLSAVATVREAPAPPAPEPTPEPTTQPTPEPSSTSSPSATPTPEPTPTATETQSPVPTPTPTSTPVLIPSPSPSATRTVRPSPAPVKTVTASPAPTATVTVQPKPSQSTTPVKPTTSPSATPRATTTPGQRYDYRDLPAEQLVVVEPNADEGMDTISPIDPQEQASDTQLPTLLESEPTPGQSASPMLPFLLTGAAAFALAGGYVGMRIGRRRKAKIS